MHQTWGKTRKSEKVGREISERYHTRASPRVIARLISAASNLARVRQRFSTSRTTRMSCLSCNESSCCAILHSSAAREVKGCAGEGGGRGARRLLGDRGGRGVRVRFGERGHVSWEGAAAEIDVVARGAGSPNERVMVKGPGTTTETSSRRRLKPISTRSFAASYINDEFILQLPCGNFAQSWQQSSYKPAKRGMLVFTD